MELAQIMGITTTPDTLTALRTARVPRLAGAALVATTGLLALYAGSPRLPRAYAAGTCTVTNTNDSGDGSLRDALLEVRSATCDTIDINTSGTLTLLGDLPRIDFTGPPTSSITTLTINGHPGFTIDGSTRNGFDFYDQSPTTREVVLDRVNVTHAREALRVSYLDLTMSRSTFTANHGLAKTPIWTYGGATTITDSTFSGNDATAGYPPSGVGNFYGPTTLRNSTFTGNSGRRAGAVYVGSGSQIIDSTFSNNTSRLAGAVSSRNGSLSVRGSTFSGNSATGTAGALEKVYGTLTIANSTFANNTSQQNGGAVYCYNCDVSAQFSTFTANTSATGGQTIDTYKPSSNVTLKGSVLSTPSGNNCSDPASAAQYTFVASEGGDDTSCGSPSPGGITNATGSGLMLGGLADNGGPTLTIRPLTGSPLIGAAPNALGTGINTDQRGVSRTSPFTVGSVQISANTGPTGLMVRSAPGTIMSRWNSMPDATIYRAALTLQPRGGTATTRTTQTGRTQAQWLVKPAPGSAYTVCVRAFKSSSWSSASCKSSTVGATDWRGASKRLPDLTGSLRRATR